MTLANAAQIGATQVALVTLDSLGIPDPKMIYLEGEEAADLWSVQARILGLPIVIWDWGYVERAWRTSLRAYCASPAISSEVYIETQTNENSDEFRQFRVSMRWPLDEGRNIDGTYRIPFRIQFFVLEDVTPAP